MGYYCMVDRPAMKIVGERKVKYINKPRREHATFEIAMAEAQRLSLRTKARVLVLHVVDVVRPEGEQ